MVRVYFFERTVTGKHDICSGKIRRPEKQNIGQYMETHTARQKKSVGRQ